MAVKYILASVVGLLLVTQAHCWWDNGHMLVAQIAKQKLGRINPKLTVHLDKLLATWKHDFPNRSSFVPGATWPDFLKCAPPSKSYCQGQNYTLPAVNGMDAWHFSDIPYNPDNLTLPPGALTAGVTQPSAVDALSQMVSTFRVAHAQWGWVWATFWVLHVVGDIHQPMHAVAGFFNDSRFGHLPSGDRGGNSIKINTQWQAITNLHAIWDAAGGLYQINAPLTSSEIRMLEANATDIANMHPERSLPGYNPTQFQACWNASLSKLRNEFSSKEGYGEPCSTVFMSWANESYEFAVNSSYAHAKANLTVNSTFVDIIRSVSNKRIAMAGYRLADLFHAVSPNIPELKVPVTQPQSVTSKPHESKEINLKHENTTLTVLSGVLTAISLIFVVVIYRLKKQLAMSVQYSNLPSK